MSREILWGFICNVSIKEKSKVLYKSREGNPTKLIENEGKLIVSFHHDKKRLLL